MVVFVLVILLCGIGLIKGYLLQAARCSGFRLGRRHAVRVPLYPTVFRRFALQQDSQEASVQDGHDAVPTDTNHATLDSNLTATMPNPPEEIDPLQKAIAEQEALLQQEVEDLESHLRRERQQLANIRNKISESGKNGYFIVQAQVNDFTRKKEAEQKSRVARHKREFVEKMLPWVDAYREAPSKVAAQSEKGQRMHSSFTSLLHSVTMVMEKYGYKEFQPDIGQALDPHAHEIASVADMPESAMEAGPGPNTVKEVVRPGVRSAEGEVLRKARVVVYGEPRISPVPPAAERSSTGAEEGDSSVSSMDTASEERERAAGGEGEHTAA